MNKQVVTGKFIISSGELDCIEFKENGYLVIPSSIKELTIKKVLNEKKYPCKDPYEILVTGRDGADAPNGSGKDGEDGEDGGSIVITVLDLAGDVHIKASGGNGGFGGSGHRALAAGRGGNGGKGGDGANVTFKYNKKDEDSLSGAYVYSVRGGYGGYGGNGGQSSGEGAGKGGESEEEGCIGAKFGDGGDGGKNGENGKIVIEYPDGRCSVNGIFDEQETAGASNLPTSDFPSGARMLDLRNSRDLMHFLDVHGGESTLKNFPHILNAVKKMRGNTNDNPALSDKNSSVRINGIISHPTLTGVKNKSENAISENGTEIFNSYIFGSIIQSCFTNSSRNVSDSEKEFAVSVGYAVYVRVINLTDNIKLNEKTIYGEGEEVDRALSEYASEEYKYTTLAGKKLRIAATVTYQTNDGTLFTAELEHRDCVVEKAVAESYLNSITVTNPHWQYDGKKSGEIMFLYGRSPSISDTYKTADYFGGDYLSNSYNLITGELRTIMPISGKITLNNFKDFEVKGAKIDSYVSGEGNCPVSFLEYNISNGTKTIATHRDDISVNDLGQKMQDNGCLVYNSKDNSVTFDLKLPPKTSGKSHYDWESNLSGAFLNDSSHKCYLNACFVLNVEHKPRIGSTNDRFTIYIYSKDEQDVKETGYYTSTNGKTNVFIPPILIYWGCCARETLIKTADGYAKRADEINIGDKLTSYGGKILTVSDILTGEDDEIYKIETKDGNSIRVSGGHAMKVYSETNPDGKRVIAKRISIGDKLISPFGLREVTAVFAEAYEDTVYNFIFEEEKTPNYIEANGFWSGDFYAQNEEEKKPPVILSDEAKVMIAEFKELGKMLKAC
ncbi:MAG: hypothetical protein LBS21_15505 [Clostridiales bacterium]|jgi:hypothetical protein|nr:hypothetical protein [Clostridiales bacterium]